MQILIHKQEWYLFDNSNIFYFSNSLYLSKISPREREAYRTLNINDVLSSCCSIWIQNFFDVGTGNGFCLLHRIEKHKLLNKSRAVELMIKTIIKFGLGNGIFYLDKISMKLIFNKLHRLKIFLQHFGNKQIMLWQ